MTTATATETATTTGAAAATTAATSTTAAPAAGTATPAATTAAVTPAAASPATTGTLIGGDPAAPEIVYKLELPKDSLLTPGHLEKTVAFSREQGFSNEVAQKVLAHREEGVKEYVEAQRTAYQEMPKKWLEETRALYKEEAKFKEDVALVAKFSKDNFSKETLEFLNESGFGNHPKLFGDILKWARKAAPDRLVQGSATTVGKIKTADELLFPNSLGTGEKK